MIDNATLDRLEACIRRECRSMMQYTSEVPMWIGPDDRSAYELVKSWSRTERQNADDISDWLKKQHAIPMQIGPFPTVFTSWNDTSFRHILPGLMREHAKNLTAMESDLEAILSPEPHALLETTLAHKREHAAAFQTIVAAAHHR